MTPKEIEEILINIQAQAEKLHKEIVSKPYTVMLRITHDGKFKSLNNPSSVYNDITDIHPAQFDKLKSGVFSVQNIELIGFRNVKQIDLFLKVGFFAAQFTIYKK